ncbi:MAG: peptide deformylase, partial [Acidimicrobiales bacterium]
MAPYDIRIFGDPVLRQTAKEVTDVDDTLVTLAADMAQTMYDAPGVGLAAPQVGVQKRLFVYDLHDGEGARTIVNPVITEGDGEWVYEEGCLSIPG